MALDFAAGCIGGMAGIVAGHPLDTVKVRVQTGGGGALRVFRSMSASALYRGVGPPLLGVAGVNAIVFGTFGTARRTHTQPDSLRAHVAAGATAGLVQSLLLCPVELVKTRQQLGEAPAGLRTAVRHIYRKGGARALYRGLFLTAARDTPAFAIYFASYEALTLGDKSAGRVFAAGGVAGVLSWVLLYPIDVVKSRVQADAAGKYAGAWDCAVRSVRTEGWACMRRGLAPITMRAFISNGACFSAVAWTERAWQALPSNSETHDRQHAELHVFTELHDVFPHFHCA